MEDDSRLLHGPSKSPNKCQDGEKRGKVVVMKHANHPLALPSRKQGDRQGRTRIEPMPLKHPESIVAKRNPQNFPCTSTAASSGPSGGPQFVCLPPNHLACESRNFSQASGDSGLFDTRRVERTLGGLTSHARKNHCKPNLILSTCGGCFYT